MDAWGRLTGKEIFLLTDNKVFENAYYKDHLPSPKLNAIIFRLHKLKAQARDRSHLPFYPCRGVLHDVGYGIEGLLCGDFMTGIMAGMHPLTCLPLHLGANERSEDQVQKWVNFWSSPHGIAKGGFSGRPLKLLSPEDWFTFYKNNRPQLWCPLPASMATVVELFNDNWLAHPKIPHVFCLSRLMTHLWRKTLSNDADLTFKV